MGRYAKNNPTALVKPILDDFAKAIGITVEKIVLARVAEVLRNGTNGRLGRARKKRSKISCYYPGCKNVAAPRFGMFCAALHKRLPAAEKEKYRARRQKAK